MHSIYTRWLGCQACQVNFGNVANRLPYMRMELVKTNERTCYHSRQACDEGVQQDPAGNGIHEVGEF